MGRDLAFLFLVLSDSFTILERDDGCSDAYGISFPLIFLGRRRLIERVDDVEE